MNDGGPAFPCESGRLSKGMSLFDWFAGMAMQGILASSVKRTVTGMGERPESRQISDLAYRLAADMLAERERRMEK